MKLAAQVIFLELFCSVALAAPKATPIPAVVTNFLTEEDLNKSLTRFIYWLVGIAVPIIIIEAIRAWQERKRGLSKAAIELRDTVAELKIIVKRLDERPTVSHADIRNISREEAVNVIELFQRAGRPT